MKQYVSATALNRYQVADSYKYKTISVTGTVKDVVDWDTFDERSDRKARYYKVIIAPRPVAGMPPCEVWLFYRDKTKAEVINKGQAIETSGALIKIIGEGGEFTVWLYGEDLNPEDKFMLGL